MTTRRVGGRAGRGCGWALCLSLVLAFPAAGQPAEGAGPPALGRIAVGADAVPDAEIAERIGGIVTALPEFRNVGVAVRGGVVFLEGSVPEPGDAARLQGLAERVEGVVAVRNQVETAGEVGERLLPAFVRVQARLRQVVDAIPLILFGLLVFALIAGLGLVLTHRERPFRRLAPNAFVAGIIRQVVRIVFVLVGLALTLDLMGATALLGAILGAAGIIGLAVGFGVRDTIENFVASVMLSLRQPFAPNDLVEIEGELGRVIRLTSRATVLLSLDGNHVRLPNAVVFKSKIVNYSREPHRRFVFTLGVDPDADLAGARETGLRALRAIPFVLDDPPAAAWVEGVGDSNVVMSFAGWIDQKANDFPLARGEAIRMVKLALETAGFALPEPVYRLRFDRRDGAALEGPAAPAGAAAPRPPAPQPAADAAAAPRDVTIERKVAADREATPERDLLGRGGRPE